MSLFTFDETKDHTPAIERCLLKHNADINAVDKDNRTPIFYLFFKHESIQSLNQKNPNYDPANIVMQLIENGRINNINQRDRNQSTVLHYACCRGATISALTIINKGADINLTNVIGNSPFTEALICQKTDICIFLIQNNCNIDISVTNLVLK